MKLSVLTKIGPPARPGRWGKRRGPDARVQEMVGTHRTLLACPCAAERLTALPGYYPATARDDGFDPLSQCLCSKLNFRPDAPSRRADVG